MADPRLDGSHLEAARRDPYDASVCALLDARGWYTSRPDPLITRPPRPQSPARGPQVVVGGTYVLVGLRDGHRHRLRVGVNALGRSPTNDLVAGGEFVSRRHCLVLVHATGGCEVADTASTNGTQVNGRPVRRAELCAGDVLGLYDQGFRVEWEGPDGQVVPPAGAAETSFLTGPATARRPSGR